MDGAPESLSAKFPGTFAYFTIKDRLPVILTKIIDATCRCKDNVARDYGEEGTKDLKTILAELAELRYRIVTDKPLLFLQTPSSDQEQYNDAISQEKANAEDPANEPSWFKSAWLFVECYFYRRIMASFQNSRYLNTTDPFRIQKEQSYLAHIEGISLLASTLKQAVEEGKDDIERTKHYLSVLMQVALWGNKSDLSISSGEHKDHVMAQEESHLHDLAQFVLVNHIPEVTSLLLDKTAETARVDIILDNAGFELFTDLCLADYLLETRLTNEVRLHAKAIPWFVSDVTVHDFDWTIRTLKHSDHKQLKELGEKWSDYVDTGKFKVSAHTFWTLPYGYFRMQTMAPDLYTDLSDSKLAIFKGDLNYRKLTGDLKWPHTTTYKSAMRGFTPCPHVALRTLKADVVTGLQPGQAEACSAKEEHWMTNGNWAVVQFCS